ncbi:kynurenine formamidase [[Candida] anglica]|uniref:Kynurenine formamidase n=1 Tax=[Candida] anglica TaxID=148631 RepID=A0ABP0EM20_9ASCO
MTEFCESFGNDELQKIKIFRWNKNVDKNVIFVHGGAWRDPSNTFDDFQDFAKHLIETTNCNVFGLNYRLSPEFKHPYHLIDVVQGLNHLYEHFGVSKVHLIGHSVGATLLLQVLNAKDTIERGLVNLSGNIDDIVVLNTSIEIEALFLIDGIYDIPGLIEEYPGYISFVKDAFISPKHYTDGTDIYNHQSYPKLIIIQSLQDELLSLQQTHLLQSHLDKLNIQYSLHSGEWGLHEQVYRTKQVFNLISDNI